MSRIRARVLVSVFVFVSGMFAQTSLPSNTPSLRIELAADAPTKGFPKSFTVTFFNTSDHEMRFPKPSISCQNSLDGTLTISYKFTPKEPRIDGIRHGCVCDYFNPPAVLERVKSWSTIAPGAAIKVQVSAEKIYLEFPETGRYVLTAHYDPPDLTPSEQAMLTNAGIYFPREKLVSETIRAIKP